MSVQIVGLDSFISNLGLAKTQTKKVVEAAALNIALEVRRLAQGRVARRSGELQRSIVAEPIEYGAQTTVNEKYGVWLEEGTGMYDPNGAHLIYPTNAQAMVWTNGGEKYGARWTRGMEAQPFFWPSVDDADPFVGEQMGLAVNTLLRLVAA